MRRGRESLWPRTIYSMCGANDTRIEFPLHTCRYIGRAKARLQAAWAAALVNLNPIGRHLIAQTA